VTRYLPRSTELSSVVSRLSATDAKRRNDQKRYPEFTIAKHYRFLSSGDLLAHFRP
jgi:hypothetical protein